jgi:hypothetical protein
MELDIKNKLRTTFNPKVSIVIPVFNGSDYLNEALDSALTQTYNNIEIIVVNDGSNDNGKTEKIALSYGDRIRYFKKGNGGTASALNLGIKEMKGEYFSWLSHDDLYYPEKIEAQINFLVGFEDRLTIIYTDFNYIDGNSNFLYNYPIKHVPPEHFRPAFIWGGIINGCTLLIPKKCFEIYGVFKEKLRTTQDYDLWFRLSEKYSFVHLPQILIKSRIHENQGINKLRPIMNVEENRLFTHFITKIKQYEIKQYYEKPVPIFYLDYSRVMLNAQLYKAANFSFLLSLVTFWRLKVKYIYEYLHKIGNVVKTNIIHSYRSFKNTV